MNKKILVVEDYELYREIESTRLKMAGYNVDIATNGQEAVDIYLRNDPFTYSAILMDIIMPVMDGRTAASLIRHAQKADSLTIPIISISADNDEDSVASSLKAGIDYFLAKPIDFADLFIKLEEVITLNAKMALQIEEKPLETKKKYDKLWKMLIDRNMKKTELRQLINCSSTTLAKLSKGEDVSITTLRKICAVLNCKLIDIMNIAEDE